MYMRTLDERLQMASELHKQGFNCCQCVAIAFDDTINIAPEALSAATVCFGGGFGGQGEVCGAISGMAIVDSMLHYAGPSSKMTVYANVRQITQHFADLNGSIYCRELRSKAPVNTTGNIICHKPCSEYIADAIRILDNKINNN